jgi:hypothetical protein
MVLAASGQVSALTIPVQGSLPACAAGLEVEGELFAADETHDCTDGDPACDLDAAADGACTLGVRVCVQRPDEGCTSQAVTRLRLGPKKLLRLLGREALAALLGTTGEACTPRVDVPIDVTRGEGTPSRLLRAKLRARSPEGKGRARLRARCLSALPVDPPFCTGGVPGQPAAMTLAIRDTSSDLDLGWKGASHNFALPAGRSTTLCLSGCDPDTDPMCDVTAVADAPERPRGIAPPLPLLTASVPVCLVSRITGPGGGTFDLSSGALDVTVPVALDVHFPTLIGEICPRCMTDGGVGASGSCSAYAERAGRACVVEGIVRVPFSSGDPEYRVSRDCLPPTGILVGTHALDLSLTTATSSLTGRPPLCARPDGFTPQADDCGDGTCGAECTDYSCDVKDASGQCIDAKGGLAQACCTTNTALPCFEGGDAGTIARAGSPAGALLPPWPDPTYPKSGRLALAGTTCLPGTGSTQVNIVAGLPGPAAIRLPLDVTIETAPEPETAPPTPRSAAARRSP